MKILILVPFVLIACVTTSHHEANRDPASTALPTGIFGKVEIAKDCPDDQTHIFIGQDKTLIYEADIPKNGTFDFRLAPGLYKATVLTKSKCSKETSFTVAANQLMELNINVQSSKRTLAYSEISPVYPGYYPMPQLPYWGYYPASYFGNYWYPGPWMQRDPWSQGGINPIYFPQGPPVYAAKPNVYLDGNRTQSFTLNVVPSQTSVWLTSIPRHDGGWTILKKKKSMEVAGTAYKFLHYDLRTELSFFQKSQGVCQPTAEAIVYMKEGLKSLGFKNSEIKDFEEFWSIKLGAFEKVCVYPQGEKELDKMAQLQATTKLDSVTRIFFLVIPPSKDGKLPHQFEAPKSVWNFAKDRKPSSLGINLREWGVGFLEAEKRF